MRRSLVTFASLAVLIARPALAQSRPSFAGEWVRVDSAPARVTTNDTYEAFRVGDMGSGWGSPITITQTPDSLVVEVVQFSTYDHMPKLRYAYAMNGAESRNTVMIGHAESVQRGRLSWNGSVLVITTIHRVPPGAAGTANAVEVRQALSLEPNGTLLVETTRPGASAPNVVRTTFRRR
jgi:hypothetical protein